MGYDNADMATHHRNPNMPRDSDADRADSTPAQQNTTPNAVGLSEPFSDYRLLFERSPDAMIIIDEDGSYLDATLAAEKLTGYTREELRQMKVGDLVAPEDRSVSLQRFQLLRKTGHARQDRVLMKKDGSQIVVETHSSKISDRCYLVDIRDISDRVHEHKKLQRSLDDFTTLVELCGAAVLSANAKGCITSWNPAAETLFGYKESEIVGQSILTLIPQRLQNDHSSAFKKRIEGDQTQSFTSTLHTKAILKNKTEIPVELLIAGGLHDHEYVLTAVIRDIGEHTDVVEKLNDALQVLRFHINRMPLAYIVWDTKFRVTEWNLTAERIFGYSKAEAIGRHAYDLIVPPDMTATIDDIWSHLLEGDNSDHSINENIRKDGSRVVCEWFNTHLLDSSGNVRGVASMAMDVTIREEIEARIRETQKMESLGVLASGVAHDFNSSLMVILGNSTLLKTVKGLPKQAHEYLETIDKAGLRANELIKHLLAYARTGRHNPQQTNLNDVINDILKLLTSTMGKMYPLDINLADQLPSIFADRSQIEQIVMNLCINAQQASKKQSTIHINTKRVTLSANRTAQCIPYDAKSGDYIELCVKDEGCGMDKATISRIFDPFFTTKVDGHGLGLAAVLGILRQHLAVAFVDSKVGQGTNFHIYFPVFHDTQASSRS